MDARSILVVDDSPDLCKLLSQLLASAGHRVLEAYGAKDALASIAAQRVDAVLTDIIMPAGDGLELITRLRSSFPQIPIIAMSGGGQYLDKEQCLTSARRLGAAVILTKPFTGEQVLKAISSVCGIP